MKTSLFGWLFVKVFQLKYSVNNKITLNMSFLRSFYTFFNKNLNILLSLIQKLCKEMRNGKAANAKEVSYCINPEVLRFCLLCFAICCLTFFRGRGRHSSHICLTQKNQAYRFLDDFNQKNDIISLQFVFSIFFANFHSSLFHPSQSVLCLFAMN